MASFQKLTPRATDYSKWYNELVVKADLAEQSAVRGCMVIKPYGYAIWETIQAELDRRFKENGVKNAYFPLLIPKSFLSREAEHVEGFAKECAVVTHHRLMNDPEGKGVVVDPKARLEEELIIRPTSETIIWSTYKNWISSYRDLPILCNQWCNVMRWEMRTRLFLRTAEFLWQEGHTAHATKEEAENYAATMLNVYADFAEKVMAIPVVKGVKSPNERFAGALNTYSIEAMMQDGKALQAGTSHFLGQNFAKSFDVQFLTNENKYEYVWATSWGVSTRLMGALIMTHSDDNGLVLPPNLAPIQVVIVPIFKKQDQLDALMEKLNPVADELKKLGIRVQIDASDKATPGFKFAEYELKGVANKIHNKKLRCKERHSVASTAERHIKRCLLLLQSESLLFLEDARLNILILHICSLRHRIKVHRCTKVELRRNHGDCRPATLRAFRLALLRTIALCKWIVVILSCCARLHIADSRSCYRDINQILSLEVD